MTDEENFLRTVMNAQRLFDDSMLLAKHDRAKSSIILGVFAIEELGKALIALWGVKNLASKREFPTHVEKQTATFILLSCGELVKKNKRRLRRKLEQGTFDFRTMGPYSEQFAWARAGFYDDIRMAMTYADKDPKLPHDVMDEIDTGNALEISEFYVQAAKLIKNVDAMALASEIYMNGLGRL